MKENLRTEKGKEKEFILQLTEINKLGNLRMVIYTGEAFMLNLMGHYTTVNLITVKWKGKVC